MRLSLITAAGIAAVLGIMAIDIPDANALARQTVISSPRGKAVITRRPGRMVSVRRLRGARASVIGRPGLRCRTVIVNGVRVRRCS